MGTFYTGASGVGTGPHLDFRIWDVDKGSYINPSGFTDVLSVNDKPLTEQFNMTSGFGPRPVPTPGASSNHLGIDYATPAGTPVQIKGGKFITTFNDARGGRMSQYGIQRDGKNYDVLLLHGSNQNQLLSDGARTDFDYSSLGTPNLRPQAKERAEGNKGTLTLDERSMIFDNMMSDAGVKSNTKSFVKSFKIGFDNFATASKSLLSLYKPTVVGNTLGLLIK